VPLKKSRESSFTPLALVPGALGRRLFPVAWLVAASGQSRRVLDGMLRHHGVELVRVGRSNFISLTELEDKIPVLWEGIRHVEWLRSLEEERDDV
jgi:hypothetical protein